jgi:hypothetical protein
MKRQGICMDQFIVKQKRCDTPASDSIIPSVPITAPVANPPVVTTTHESVLSTALLQSVQEPSSPSNQTTIKNDIGKFVGATSASLSDDTKLELLKYPWQPPTNYEWKLKNDSAPKMQLFQHCQGSYLHDVVSSVKIHYTYLLLQLTCPYIYCDGSTGDEMPEYFLDVVWM